MMAVPSLLDQCRAAATAGPIQAARAWPANPLREGIRQGSTTDRVLRVLVGARPGVRTAGDLRRACNAGRGAVDWALRYLAQHGMVKCLPDGRQTNYRRYRATDLAVAMVRGGGDG